MTDGYRMSGPHLIKLQDKNIRVQLEYHSPPKKEAKGRANEISLYQLSDRSKDEVKPVKKIRNLNSYKSIKRVKLTKASPYYYRAKIE
jgi:hypothetical protein